MAFSNRPHLRFAAATAAVIATAGAALFWFVHHQEIRQAERDVTRHAQYAQQGVLRDELRREDLAAPVSGARRDKLDWLFRERVLTDGGLRVKLYRARDGLVTYSNDHSLIGTRIDDVHELREVLRGHVVHDVARINHEGGSGRDVKALEVYVPIQLRGSAHPDGVFEVYEPYAPVTKAVRSFVAPFTALLLLTLAGLWIALFPLVQRMVRAVERDREARESAEQALSETAEQLRQSQKMEAIGRLAGGIAHDFNNLLLAINGYSEFLADSLTGERERRFAAEIHAAGQRAAALTQQLLAFSRRQVMQPRVMSLNEAVTEIESILRRLIGADVQAVLDLDPRLPYVEADPAQIGQVLLNLAVNARDAMAGAGTLSIATRAENGSVLLDVSDTGTGMDEATRLRIFEPFFTTKLPGHGTGLGLSTVYGIVAQSGGTISVDSAPGRGSVFTISLPQTDRTPERLDEPGHSAASPGGERVLVVDDDLVVRELVAQMLREQGYEVETAASAAKARKAAGSFDLLITDVVLPEMNGVELARHIDARRVLFISGYDQNGVLGDAAFLQKPFGRDALARAVRELLAAPALTSATA